MNTTLTGATQMISNQQKLLVQTSFEKVLPIAELAAKLFYNRLFELDPSLRLLFKSDMEEQGKKLMVMLQIAVKGLDRLDELVPAIQQLGQRHSSYGVQNSHYDTVGQALIWTLGMGLGEDFTPATKDAWLAVYSVLAHTMESSSKQPNFA
jgi:hemoglobin-like flavoprotein